MQFSGYIEGYYGRHLTWPNRHALIDSLARLGLNTYLYAPKEDPFHRMQWRTPYPAVWQKALENLITYGHQKKVSVIPALAPGLSYNYNNTRDYAALLRKFIMLCSHGAKTVALLMDDIPDTLPAVNAQHYSSLGAAHAQLINRLKADVQKKHPSTGFWFCPTVYCDSFARGPIAQCRYLRDLADTIDPDVYVMWTGPNVIAQTLSKQNCHQISTLFKGKLVIWDNVYANDYCPFKLFFGPFAKRTQNLKSVAAGLLLNPTGLFGTDTFLLGLLAGFMQDKKPISAWNELISGFEYKKQIKTILPFFNIPESPLPGLSTTQIARYRRALKPLIWEWKSPLQCEWYPHLTMLDKDLFMLEKIAQKKEVTARWLAKVYPAIWADLFDKKINTVCR